MERSLGSLTIRFNKPHSEHYSEVFVVPFVVFVMFVDTFVAFADPFVGPFVGFRFIHSFISVRSFCRSFDSSANASHSSVSYIIVVHSLGSLGRSLGVYFGSLQSLALKRTQRTPIFVAIRLPFVDISIHCIRWLFGSSVKGPLPGCDETHVNRCSLGGVWMALYKSFREFFCVVDF